MAVDPRALIWATRPAAQNTAWCERLSQAGFAVLNAPLMEIEPVTGDAQETLKQHILRLDEFDVLIFVSQNAVEYAVAWVDRYWPQWPIRQTRIAVGAATAALLGQHLPDVLTPTIGMDSNAVLAMPQLQQVNELKILIFRGQGGLPVMGQELTKRGAQVEYCELYERKSQHPQPRQLARIEQALDQQGCVVSVFSGETLQNLFDCLSSNQLLQGSTRADKLTLLVPGKRVAALAQELGFRRIITAANASEAAMFAALVQ